jgi:hypothetical protein
LAEVPQFVHDAQLSYDEFIESPGQETLLLGGRWRGGGFGVGGWWFTGKLVNDG